MADPFTQEKQLRRTVTLALLLAAFSAHNACAQAGRTVRITTWNLEWFPNGSAKTATSAEQAKTIKAAADVLRELDPDIILLQEVSDGNVCERLADAIAPGLYQLAICSNFRGRQQEAILAKTRAQAAWAEQWNNEDGVDPPRGFAFAWLKSLALTLGCIVST